MSSLVAVARTLAGRPGLWPVAVGAAWSARSRRWWRRPPFLPVPDRAWLRWRTHTAYGDDRDPDVDDVIEWLEWRRRFEGLTR